MPNKDFKVKSAIRFDVTCMPHCPILDGTYMYYSESGIFN